MSTPCLTNVANKLKSRLVIDKYDIVAVIEVNCKFSGSDVEFNIDSYKTIYKVASYYY